MSIVTVLKKDGAVVGYNNYASAREAIRTSSNNHDLVQIWGDLDEQILLLDGVDIWIAPGVKLNRTGATPTIIDNDSNYTDPVNCTIYGDGIIMNSYSSGDNPRFECIKIINANSKLSVNCDLISGKGGKGEAIAPTINIVNAKKFHLKCNRVYNETTLAINIGAHPNLNFVEDVSIKANTIEVGPAGLAGVQNFGIITSGNGIIKVNEVICQHHGHCLWHLKGNITANIKKLTTTNNEDKGDGTVNVDHGTDDRQLVLYFDEIIAETSDPVDITSGVGVQHGMGTCILIGNKIFSRDNQAVLKFGSTKGYIKCSQLTSLKKNAMEFLNFTENCIINSDLITGNGGGEIGAIYSYAATFTIKNAKIENLFNQLDCRGIVLVNFGGYPNLTLQNVKIITQNVTNKQSILATGTSPADVKNFGLFTKYSPSNVNLKIGTSTNHLYIENSDL